MTVELERDPERYPDGNIVEVRGQVSYYRAVELTHHSSQNEPLKAKHRLTALLSEDWVTDRQEYESSFTLINIQKSSGFILSLVGLTIQNVEHILMLS